jgi:hypothetical protein
MRYEDKEIEREKVIKRNGKGDMWEWIGEKVER